MPNQEVMLAKLTRREFETSLALALFPENIRHDAMHDQVESSILEWKKCGISEPSEGLGTKTKTIRDF